MVTALLLLFPVFASLLTLAFKGKQAKYVALSFSLVELLFGLYAWFNFDNAGGFQYLLKTTWVASLGINFNIGMDGISLLLVLLTVVLIPLIILASFNKEHKNPSAFYALILFMQAGLVGVFVSMDAFLFYVTWEAALIPIYFIAALWGEGENKIKAAFKFFIYTIIGSFFMLVGIIYLYLQTPGAHSFDIGAFYALSLTAQQQFWIFLAFFIAFAIKMPLFPFHTWQPDAYTAAPTAGTMLLSGIMLKMGIYGVIRWIWPVVPVGAQQWADVVMILAIIGIIYASIIAFKQQDIKRLVAYSSIAHVGLIAAGVFALNTQALQGAMIQMVNHGINVVGLFFVVDIIASRTNTRNRSKLGGIVHKAPIFATCFMVIMLGTVALPLTNGFIGEFLLLSGIFEYKALFSVLGGLTIILGAVYMFRMYKDAILGEANSLTEKFSDISLNEKIVLFVIVALVLFVGVYPKPILAISENAVSVLLEQVNTKFQTFSELTQNANLIK